MRAILEDSSSAAESAAAVWESPDLAYKRAVIKALMTVTCTRRGARARLAFDPATVQVVWCQAEPRSHAGGKLARDGLTAFARRLAHPTCCMPIFFRPIVISTWYGGWASVGGPGAQAARSR